MGVVFWLAHSLYRVLYSFIHIILAFYHKGKKQIVPPIKYPLLLKSASKLAEEIREGKVKSEEVVQAYVNRILEVEPYINAVVQDRFTEALEEAKEVDKIISEITYSESFSKQQLADEKPFFGVPFTIKLLIKVKGLPCTAGSKLFEHQIAEEDAHCVALIKKAGGIILANTNTPEFGFSLECFNLLYGQTRNPYDTTRTPGASSGGEGALLGAGASVVGVGNDMLGSVRLPAHFCGIFSHKPSKGLVVNSGSFPVPHPDHLPYIFVGPMCRYSEDLQAVMKVFTEENPIRLKFGQKVDFRNLKIYYSTSIKDFGMLPVDKEIVSSMLKAISHFTKKYDVAAKKVEIPLIERTIETGISRAIAPLSNIVNFITLGKVDHINLPLEHLKLLFGKSTFSFPPLLWIMGNKLLSRFIIGNNPTSQKKYEIILGKLRKELDELLDDENAIFIYPTHPVPAPYHYEMSTSLPLSWAYTGTFDFTGHPATQCPLGINKEGLPYGMQIIGGMNNDPLTIACAAELEKVFGGWIPPKPNNF
ncbi:fatty-acid amide hydrolase 2 [Parasteatoda tepidariorum]|uniref:fatty-acid amide hydrolase 2 n=1 Tax=Parasteatoda tepidariorum TaxID=114398 RepID=UPI001C71F799|nr:fatty-acid amide hydrolase 2 [Parasteatoda tepidariorum]